ncbi:MAG: hypothetical protein HY347_03335 [candidate division NC10 bacterium]|nr:hypothetical protein [candidate division NC10 bacterium]
MNEERELRIAELYRQGVPVEHLAERFGMTVAVMKTLLAKLAKQGYLPRIHGRTKPQTARPQVKEATRVTKNIRIRPEVWERLRGYVEERRSAGQEVLTASEALEQAVEEYLSRHSSSPRKKDAKKS